MGYFNPLLRLPSAQKILALPDSPQKRLLEQLLRELRADADRVAEESWRRRKGIMGAVLARGVHLREALCPRFQPSNRAWRGTGCRAFAVRGVSPRVGGGRGSCGRVLPGGRCASDAYRR